MRQPDNAPCVGASVVSAAVPVRKTADTPTRARQSSVFPGACVRGKHSAWPSTAPHRPASASGHYRAEARTQWML